MASIGESVKGMCETGHMRRIAYEIKGDLNRCIQFSIVYTNYFRYLNVRAFYE